MTKVCCMMWLIGGSCLWLSQGVLQPACRTVPTGLWTPPKGVSRGGLMSRRRTMLPQSDATSQQCRHGFSWAAAAALFLGVILGRPVLGAEPTPAEALDAHGQVRAWVRAWSVPALGEAGSLGPAVHGAAVAIRLDGRVLARSAWFSVDAPSTEAVWRAAGEAIREARDALPVANDALADEQYADLGERATVSLELYGPSVPVPDAELEMPLAGCSPGAEALVVSSPAGTVVTSVDSILTRGADPRTDFGAQAARLSGQGETALTPLPDLAAAGFRFARAPVVHVAMPFEGAAPVFLDRGSRVVGDEASRTAGLAQMADRVAAHLRSRVWPGVERYGISGDLNAVSGASEPLMAGAFEQGLAALALLRHASLGGAEAGDSRATALDILRDLSAVEAGEDTAWESPVTAAAAVGALSMLDASERSADPELEALRARCVAAVRDGFDPAGGFAASVPTAARGLVAWGLVRALELDDSVKRETAEAAVRSVFRETPPSQLASQTPFVVWAELELHPDGAVPSIAVLEEMRSLVWDHQLRRSDLRPMDRDLAGGVVFTRGRAVLPTWQTMRPLAALARMMGDERLTPGGPAAGRVPGELVRVSEGLRFVRQLAMTDDGLFLARRADQAAWGVRGAPWDPTLRVEASAMALLSVSEALDSMGRIAARSGSPGVGQQAKP
jgi:hypothetical protein